MRKLMSFMLAASFLLVAAVAGAKAPNVVTIDKCKKRKAPVVFNHEQHAKKLNISCVTCHHKAKSGEKPKACFECHQCKKGEAPSAKKAFHKKCIKCHKKEKKGPRRCSQCHAKK